MADNTVLNSGVGGDSIRTVAKTVASPAKTQMNIIDVGGGAAGSAETALTAGTAGSPSAVVLSVQGLAAGTPLPVVGQGFFELLLTITRPANTTAYSAGQLLSTATSGLTALPTIATGLGANTRLLISELEIISSNGAAATKGQFAVFLFPTPSPSGAGFNDASTFNPTAAALATAGVSMIGALGTTGLTTNAGTASYSYVNQTTRFAKTDGSGNLYAAIVIANAYTPASGEQITLRLLGRY